MLLSRRSFGGSVVGLALSAPLSLPAWAQARQDFSGALSAIRAYAQKHLSYFNLPGLTLGITAPGSFSTVLNFGFADVNARSAITPDTLFQIGSISKAMTAAVIHQLVAEGRLRLDQRVSDILPILPLPRGNAVTIQHLLDHSAGLADSPPLFGASGLWTGYAPGAHWHYSNSGYEILGKIAEHAAGKPLAQLLRDRIFAPLGMERTRGAILGSDRVRYAQGYEAADTSAAYARGVPLEPSAWVDVTFGAGSVASTSDDMVRFLRSLADAAQGRGGLGLSPAAAKLFTSHAVPSDTAGMTYGNGLMHLAGGGRSYLHHTGGMVGFSSSFHVDVSSGVGAFASTNLSAFAEYRPRQLTRFAVDAVTGAIAGRPLASPPRVDVPLPDAASYAGRYTGPSGDFEVRLASPLTIVAGGEAAALQPWGGDLFRTAHPAFRQFSVLFERQNGAVAGASWGPASFLRQGARGQLPSSDPSLAKLAGRYVNDSPWFGTANVVERGGRLWIGTELPMSLISENLWRIGPESWSPERGSFADFIDGRPQTFVYSGELFLRHDV